MITSAPHPNYANQSTVGGFFETGRTDNSYHTFNAGGQDWLVLSLEWGPRNEVVQWANTVVANHASHKVMLSTHAYMYNDNTIYDWETKGTNQQWNPNSYPYASNPGETINDGQQLWEKLVSQHENFNLTFNGHVLGDGTGFRSTEGVSGNAVHQMLANYQMNAEGGMGDLRLLEFKADGETVVVRTYSPSLDRFDNSFDQEFVLKLNELHAPATVTNVNALAPVGGNYVKPEGLLSGGDLDQLHNTQAPPAEGGASLRGWRNNTQTFTVGEEAFPDGVEVTGFAINFLNRSATNNPEFGVRLFRVDDEDPLSAEGPDLVFNPGWGEGSLKYPTLAEGGEEGTYVFEFDEAVILEPGTYAWQFLTADTGSNNSSFNPVWWVTSVNDADPYDGGAFYMSDFPTGVGGDMVVFNNRDAAFGLIGSVIIPEPASLILMGLGGFAMLRRRKV